MKQFNNISDINSQQGAFLLEALIAVLIFSFGILAISGLRGVMIKNSADASMRAEASYVVQQQIGDILANPVGIGSGQVPVPSLPNGQLTVTTLANSQLRFVVTWQAPGQDQHNYEAVTSIVTAR